MNDTNDKVIDTYRSFLLLSEISGNEFLSQRDLSRRLGIALGLVNSYLKNLVTKGYVRVKNFPRNHYAYLLTPQGVAEKTRLAYQHMSYFHNLYKVARHDYLVLFRRLEVTGVKQVVFYGVDEVAEIAYLSLEETTLELMAVMDEEKAGERFFNRTILPPAQTCLTDNVKIVITSLKRAEELQKNLLDIGIASENILFCLRG